jgi:hypothetical protein
MKKVCIPATPLLTVIQDFCSVAISQKIKLTGKSEEGIITHKKRESRFVIIETRHAGHWWLMPVILATQEAEIRRILV